MTPAQHTTLATLAARFRSRSESARTTSLWAEQGMKIHDEAGRHDSFERLLDQESYERTTAKATAWAQAADDLEAFLRACEVEVEGRG